MTHGQIIRQMQSQSPRTIAQAKTHKRCLTVRDWREITRILRVLAIEDTETLKAVIISQQENIYFD